MVQFNDLVPQINRIDQRIHQVLGLVEGMADRDVEIEREVESGSPYWANERSETIDGEPV
jgi:hypothetical protein